MALHHPPLLTFEESLARGARLHLRQQDALRRASEAAGLSMDQTTKAIDAYLRRMTETEIRHGPRRAAASVPAGQTTVHEQLADVDDHDDEDAPAA